MHKSAHASAIPGDPRLAAQLRREIRGEVLFDRASRGRYATDASIYQVAPVGVIVPETVDDVAAALAIAREHGVPVLPRGGGTSQCGQTVNRALIIDCSKHLRRVLAIDPEARTARVEPGLVLGHLNAALRPHGLFFPVDPSTHARCTIGGMAGNNSCGAKSIRYGMMADNVRAIDAILADGTRYCFGDIPDNLGADIPAHLAGLIQRLRALGAAEAREIAARFPSSSAASAATISTRSPRPPAPPGGAISRACWSAPRARSPSRPRCRSRSLRSSRAKWSASASSPPSARRWRRRSTSCGSIRRRSNWSTAP